MNNLFIVEPSLQSFITIFNASNITVCNSNCVPSLLFDLFVSNNITLIPYSQLTSGLVNAWTAVAQQIKNSNTGTAKILSIDPNWQTGQSG